VDINHPDQYYTITNEKVDINHHDQHYTITKEKVDINHPDRNADRVVDIHLLLSNGVMLIGVVDIHHD
jgi:hypothetical protein